MSLHWFSWIGPQRPIHFPYVSFLLSYFYILFLTRFLIPLRFLTIFLCAFYSATCRIHLDIIQYLFFLIIKPISCTNFPNISCHETLHVPVSSSAHHQEFIHCTLSKGLCHTGLYTAFEQQQDGKKRHHHIFLHANKSGTPKYRVRVKLKCSYWHINWCSGLFFFDVWDIGQNRKIINWKSWNFVGFFEMFYSFDHVWISYRIKILPCRVSLLQYKYKSLHSSVYLPVCPSPKSKLWSWRKSFCFITKLSRRDYHSGAPEGEKGMT
jgi:hypothetical protein